MSDSPPVIGAALTVEDLASYRDWILEKNRDLEIQSFYTAEVLEGDWQPMVDEARKRLAGYSGRLGIHGPFWGFSIDTMDPDVRTVVQKRLDQGLDVCAALGADQMVIHSPYTTWNHNNLDMGPTGRRHLLEDTHATIGPAVRRAEAQGVTLVLENIEDIDPQDRKRLAESFGSDAVRLSLDTGHAQYAHVTTGAPPVDYFVRAAGDWLHHVHLQDADGYADRHWGLGRGTVNWPAVFEALAMAETAPRLILELRDAGEIPASMAYLEAAGLGQ
jgi:sugar phosphate isomerase/epimerase